MPNKLHLHKKTIKRTHEETDDSYFIDFDD